ncbi:MAG: class I SAM-dependent methyltransferase [Salaquimonas sp.]|jgi:phosphoglycolate phosphatase|nr:class I SAM-dependent methyltransferase [Salaquimonas sp.]
MHCNICGGTEFEVYRGRPNEVCTVCGSKARHRIALDVYERLLFPHLGEGARVLHLAPRDCLFDVLAERLGAGYITTDAEPERYPHASPKEVVLPDDFDKFPAGHFDAILHNHVLEHIPGHWKDHLTGLVRWLKPGGVMIFSIPGPYRDGPTVEGGEHLPSDAERLEKFLQEDHFRLFGNDLEPFLRDLEGGELLSDGVTDERRAELGVRPGKAPFFVWRKQAA